MKKFLAIIAIASLAVACKGKSEKTNTTDTTTVAPSVDTITTVPPIDTTKTMDTTHKMSDTSKPKM